jgi:hypothetical protein
MPKTRRVKNVKKTKTRKNTKKRGGNPFAAVRSTLANLKSATTNTLDKAHRGALNFVDQGEAAYNKAANSAASNLRTLGSQVNQLGTHAENNMSNLSTKIQTMGASAGTSIENIGKETTSNIEMVGKKGKRELQLVKQPNFTIPMPPVSSTATRVTAPSTFKFGTTSSQTGGKKRRHKKRTHKKRRHKKRTHKKRRHKKRRHKKSHRGKK